MTMTKKEKNIKYKNKMKGWKDRNYTTFCFHLPKELVKQFRICVKENEHTQRQILIEFMQAYIIKTCLNNIKKGLEDI